MNALEKLTIGISVFLLTFGACAAPPVCGATPRGAHRGMMRDLPSTVEREEERAAS
jgi:hypothetical protein